MVDLTRLMQQNKAGLIIVKKDGGIFPFFRNIKYTMIHENKTNIEVLKI